MIFIDNSSTFHHHLELISLLPSDPFIFTILVATISCYWHAAGNCNTVIKNNDGVFDAKVIQMISSTSFHLNHLPCRFHHHWYSTPIQFL